jgi:uncharacterized protein (DUF1501 family)
MDMMATRRHFLKGAALGAAFAALPPGARLVMGATSAKEPLLFVLLRGGTDGLNLIAPADDKNLIAARSATLIPSSGFQLAGGLTAQDWRLHPSAPELNSLYQARQLAIVHAAGIPFASRSHFEMQQLAEAGAVDLTTTTTLGGWIGRYAAATAVNGTFAVSALGLATLPFSMANDYGAVGIYDANNFKINSAAELAFLQNAYANPISTTNPIATALTVEAKDALNAVQAFQAFNNGYVVPKGYGTDSLSRGLSIAAELMKHGAGLQLGAFEYDNWDTHVAQDTRFPPAVAILSAALGAFWNDVTAAGLKVTLIVMSEFGRRITSNASGGTDHGHGNMMLVLSTSVSGGRMYGQWPGLAPAQTDLGDLAVTTDSRQVLLEAIAARRHDAPANLFPSLTVAKPLNMFV